MHAFALWILIATFYLSALAQTQPTARIAIVDFAGDEGGEITALLKSSNASASKFDVVDEALTHAAVRGAGYAGSLNFKREEARALGQSLGSDFYFLGKVQTVRRSASGDRRYFESLAGIFVVESRTGRLILFDFQQAQSQTPEAARQRLNDLIKQNWPRYSDAIVAAKARHYSEIENVGRGASPAIEVLNDDELGKDVTQPVFYQRLKPVYTEQADLAGITATVELEAVFGDDGEIGEIEVTKWAGFGLDESAIATVKSLKFKPAERAGKKLKVRGLVRYNFRSPQSQLAPPQKISNDEIERLKRSLRTIINDGINSGNDGGPGAKQRPKA